MMRPAVPAPTLAVVPTLDALASDPSLAASLPRETAVSLYTRCALAEAALRARLLGDAGQAVLPPERESEEWMSAAQVEARFGLPKRWLSDHSAELGRLRIVSRPSRKVVVFHGRRLSRFLEARCS